MFSIWKLKSKPINLSPTPPFLGIEPRTLHILSMCSTPKYHPALFCQECYFYDAFLGLAFESGSDLCFPGDLELKTLGTFFSSLGSYPG